MNRGVGNHVSKDDLTPGKKGRTCKKLLTVLASGQGSQRLGRERASLLTGHPSSLSHVCVFKKQ